MTPEHAIFNLLFDGTWEVKDGIIIETTSELTKRHHPDSEFGVQYLKIIRIDGDSLVFCPSGTTNLFTWKRL